MSLSNAQLATDSCKNYAPPTTPLTTGEIDALQTHVSSWQVISNTRLVKRFECPDFLTALALTNAFGGIAENEGHHPDLTLGWGKVVVELWTHDVDGLSKFDFIVAAKYDAYVDAARS